MIKEDGMKEGRYHQPVLSTVRLYDVTRVKDIGTLVCSTVEVPTPRLMPAMHPVNAVHTHFLRKQGLDDEDPSPCPDACLS